MQPRIYRIQKYGSFVSEKQVEGYVTLPSRTFEQLQEFVLHNRSDNADALEIMGISARKGVGTILTAKNYVGVITMKDGTTIEILPKIVSAVQDDEVGTKAKMALLDMLRTLRHTPFKSLQMSSVDVAKMNILEVFIRMFIEELFSIVKRGLKCSYETVEENVSFFKGKLQFAQHIMHNFAHKERSFVAYNVFSVNRPENRLLKATLLYLYQHSTSSRNRVDLKSLMNSFGEVKASVDYKVDFAKCFPDRNTKDYNTALMWSRVFLTGKSFTAFAGSEVAIALLFPMETLFESYIATMLRKHLPKSDYEVSTQDKKYHLFDSPQQFSLRPDVVIRRKTDDALFVMDTKWKLLSTGKANNGIAQADMYQMYAYQKKYGAQTVALIYPKTDHVPADVKLEYSSLDSVTVRVWFVDLFAIQESILGIVDRLEEN